MFDNKTVFKKEFKHKINTLFGKIFEESSTHDRYLALAAMVRESMSEDWANTQRRYKQKDTRQVYYFSLEFLVGQFLESHLIYLGVRDVVEQGLRELKTDLGDILNAEPDAGLGNGGLGRLAACFLDSLASTGLPGHGYGIRYKYGLFTQKFVDGYQVELPDGWLRGSSAWEICKPEKTQIIEFGGRVEFVDRGEEGFSFELRDPQRVLAVPYDIAIPGYRNHTVNTLRLCGAETPGQPMDFQTFSRGEHSEAVVGRYSIEAISEVLYPDDSNYQNRVLRLKQQYFLVSAGLQSILARFLKEGATRDIHKIADTIVIQINDTHPSMAIPEMMRLLVDKAGLGWDEAWDIVTKTIAYTNHTIMPEALEKWPIDIVRELLPRIYMIIEEINRRFCISLEEAYPGDRDKVERMSIIGDGVVRMAHLAIVGSFSVNGVAAVHSELLKTVVLKEFSDFYPGKFNNKTNGITHRRWLLKANPGLAGLLNETIGDVWLKDPLRMKDLEKYRDDKAVLARLADIKQANKERLTGYVKEVSGVALDPKALFDVQVKRIHGYKRQLLNIFHILHLYDRIRKGEDIGQPRAFLMAGKAAPSYYFAKNVIKLANEVSTMIQREPKCKGKLSFVYLVNYGIGVAEAVIPAAEISEQISTASKEASGTSNMKFMMNGAVTLGTGDGANIEIRDYVGEDNFISFGLTVGQVLELYQNKSYKPAEVLQNDERLRVIFDMLSHGKINPDIAQDEFSSVIRSLTEYGDEFFVLQDFDGYVQAQARAAALYQDTQRWQKMSLVNIAQSGVFSSDYTIAQYAGEIWKIKPAK